MNAMVLAAGRGERLRPHTDKLPKPAIPFLNIPLFVYPVAHLETLQPDKFVFNVHYLAEEMVQSISKYTAGLATPYQVSHEKQLLGSGGGIKKASPWLDNGQTFALANGDTQFWPQDSAFLQKAYEKHQVQKADATLVTMSHPEAGKSFGGIWVDSEKRILSIGRARPTEAKGVGHYIGFAFFESKILETLPDGASCLFKDGLLPLIEKGAKAQVFQAEGEWFETGNEIDFLAATAHALELIQKPHLKNFWERVQRIASSPQELVIQPKATLPYQTQPLCLLHPAKASVPQPFPGQGFVIWGDPKMGKQSTWRDLLSPSNGSAPSLLENMVIGPDSHWQQGHDLIDKMYL